MKPHLRETWCIPPKGSAGSAACTEEVPEVYHRPHDPRRPVVCIDEVFRQLIGEVRDPLPPGPGRVERYDGVYVRDGVASLFLAFEPPAGWRHVAATDTRTRGDWAHFIRDLLDGRHKAAGGAVLVMARLNTHSVASPYEAFPPAEAPRLAARLGGPPHAEARVGAEHGRDRASALARDPPDRVGGRAGVARRVAAREARRDEAGVRADWQFATADARVKLRKLCPTTDA